jgi:hypothetical protein
MNRSREDRLLEHNSPRKVFVWLLLLTFLLGGNASLTAYQAVRFHRFNWSESIVLLVLFIAVVQSSRTLYRLLGR